MVTVAMVTVAMVTDSVQVIRPSFSGASSAENPRRVIACPVITHLQYYVLVI